MLEKIPRDGENRSNDEFDLSFPGDGADELPKEVREFTFDEGYLDDAPKATDTGKAGKEEPEKNSVDALENIFRKMTSSSPNTASPARKERHIPAAEKPVPEQSGIRRNRSERASVTVGQTLHTDEMLVYDSELDSIDDMDDGQMPEMRDYLPIRFRRYGRTGIGGGILYALFVISVSVVLACMLWMFASDVLALNKDAENAVVTIAEYEPTGDMPTVNDEGDTIQVDIDQVASELKSAGIIEYKWLFKLFSKVSHAEVKIDPGTYDVSTDLDYRALVVAMQFGSENQEITRITFPEGYTLEQIFTLLEENHICEKDELYEAAANYEFDYEFLAELPYGDASRLEGYLFPDTYDFYQGESATVAINRFLRNMETKLTEDMNVQADNQGMTIREAIILASLIEKEAASDEERATMSSVIHNRLRVDMPLQLDSTINYITGNSTFAITQTELEIDSPYNTYLYAGLPAGPICNPGLASIEAALNPESTDYWYWYAYEGESHFFSNSDDFNAFRNEHPYEEE